MRTFHVMTSYYIVDQIRNGLLVSFSNKNYLHIFEYLSPDDYINWKARDTDYNVLTQVDSMSKIYKNNFLFCESVNCKIKQKYLFDNIVVYFHLV